MTRRGGGSFKNIERTVPRAAHVKQSRVYRREGYSDPKMLKDFEDPRNRLRTRRETGKSPPHSKRKED